MGGHHRNGMEQCDALWKEAEASRSPDAYKNVLKALEDLDAASPSCDTKWRLARACKDCAHNSDKKQMEALLMRGLKYADEALATEGGATNFKAPLWKGIMLGQTTDFCGISDKVKGAGEIRDNFARAIELNPADAESKHCLGAEQAEPGFYLTNQYMIALCYKKLKQFPQSMEWLDKVLAHGAATSPDEEKALKDATELKENVAGKM